VPGPVQKESPCRKLFGMHGLNTGDGKPAEMNTEKDDQEEGEPERGHGKTDKDKNRCGLVEKRILSCGGDDSDGDGYDQDQCQ
jgi:hypothetical protein